MTAKENSPWTSYVPWIVVAIYAAVSPFFASDPGNGTLLMFAAGIVIMVVHGTQRYGAMGIFVFAAIAAIVSVTLENLSINTGFPFGWYHYGMTDATRWRIIDAPLAVAPVYVSIGYLAWTIANVALGFADERLDHRFNIVALPLMSTFIMVQFDVVQDPSTSTFAGIWTWHHGGGLFGVPLSNFLGWYLTCWIFMQLFTVYLAWKKTTVRSNPATRNKSFWLPPIAFYFLIGVTYIWQYLANDGRLILDPAGRQWRLDALYESAVIIMLFTMLPSCAFALLRLFAPREQ